MEEQVRAIEEQDHASEKQALEMQGAVILLMEHDIVAAKGTGASGGKSSEMAVTAAQDTAEDPEDNKVEMAAPDGLGDFESTITAVQHSRTAELRSSALANTAELRLSALANTARSYSYSSIEQWRRKMYEQVWDAQTRKYKRTKGVNSDEEIEEARRQWEQRQKKIIDENIKKAKAMLKKMTENKKLTEKKVHKAKVVLQKTTTNESKRKSKKKSKNKSKM